ncbi:hypothetical protein LINPERHAP1_LOCUS14228, partial [Linum perenne]
LHHYRIKGRCLETLKAGTGSWVWRRLLKHRVIKGRLSTKDRLLKWGIPVSPTCVLCDGSQDETHMHLF